MLRSLLHGKAKGKKSTNYHGNGFKAIVYGLEAFKAMASQPSIRKERAILGGGHQEPVLRSIQFLHVPHRTTNFSLRHDKVCFHPNGCHRVELVHQPNRLGLLLVSVNSQVRFDNEMATPNARFRLTLEIPNPDFPANFIIDYVQNLRSRTERKNDFARSPVEGSKGMTARC